MNEMTPRLAELGDELERVARLDLRPAPRRRRRNVLIAALVALIAVPAASVAAIELISEDEVAASLPAGSLWLEGTEPSCTVVRQDVEYRCTLAIPPGDEVGDWTRAAMPTVDATKHVNGGCRSHNAAGTEWTCWIGAAAVEQKIIGRGLLGEYSPAPGVG